MPLEGHWERVNTPLRAITDRERRLVWLIGGLVAAAALAAVVVAIVTNGPSHAGCVQLDVPSTMGGGVVRQCGDDAAKFCSAGAPDTGPLQKGALQKCRDEGYATPSD